MILGVGIDIIEVERIRGAYTKFGHRFLNRILRPEEIRYCLQHANSAPAVAGRFAAKEAVAKALRVRIGRKIGWHDIQIVHSPHGAPAIVLHGKGLALSESCGTKNVHLSLSHTQNYAAAVAIIEG